MSGRSVVPGGLRELASPLPTISGLEGPRGAVGLPTVLGSPAVKVGKTRLSGRSHAPSSNGESAP